MQRPGLAARRFYRAFYQWNALTSSIEATICASSFHTTTARHNHEENMPFRIRKHRLKHVKHAAVQTFAPPQVKSGNKKGTFNERYIPEWMLEGPIQSAADRPFHSMDAADYVIRFRSESGLMLECAVAGDVLQKAQEKCGLRLEKLKDRTGARIEVQELFKKRQGAEDLEPQNMVHSVLISGTFKEVVEAFHALEHGDDTQQGFTQLAKRDGTTWTENTPVRIPKSFKRIVRSTTEVPSSSLQHLKDVVRSRSETNIAVECAFLAEELALLKTRFGQQLEFLRWKHGAAISIQTFEKTNEPSGTINSSETKFPVCHNSILVSGTWEQTAKALNEIKCHSMQMPDTTRIEPSSRPRPDPQLQNTPLRATPDGGAILKIVAHESHWQRLMVETEFSAMAVALQVQIETGEPGLIDDRLGRKKRGRTVVLSGAPEALPSMRAMFKSCTKKFQEQERQTSTTGNATNQTEQTPDGGSKRVFVRPDEQSRALKFTSLVEICPPGEEYDLTRGYVISRFNVVRRRHQAVIRGMPGHPSLTLIRGTEDHVRSSKETIDQILAQGYERNSQSPCAMRVIHEQPDWDPTSEEVHGLLTGRLQKMPENVVDDSSNINRDLEDRVSSATYRYSLLLDSRHKRELVRSALRVTTIRKLKTGTGCQDIVLDDKGLFSYGSLSGTLKFRTVIENLMTEECRRQRRGRPAFISCQIHVKLGDAWAKLSIPQLESDVPAWTPEALAQLTEDVRLCLRPLTHPVVLITAGMPSKTSGSALPDGGGDDTGNTDIEKSSGPAKRCRGVTVSSFNTVTLQPQPMISFNLKIPSRSWEAIAENGDIRIHLLSATKMGAAIADAFTKPYKNPWDGFLEVKRMGVGMSINARGPPYLYHKDGVLASMRARVMPEQCVEVGDHVIIVARVSSCHVLGEERGKAASEMDMEFWEKAQGLAYAKQSYRTAGKELSKEVQTGRSLLPQGLPDPLRLGDELMEEKSDARAPPSRGRELTEGWTSGPAPVDPIYDALRATRDAEKSGEEVDFDKIIGTADEGFSAAVREEEDDYDFGFETPRFGVKREQRRTEGDSAFGKLGSADNDRGAALWGPEDVAREDSIRLGENEHPQSAHSDRLHSPMVGEAKLPGSRSFSTLARPRLTPHAARHFSSTARTLQDDSDKKSPVNIDELVDPSARTTNVADFLGIPENARLQSHRVRSLFRMNKDARRAERKLQLQPDSLTEEAKSELQHKITTNDRIIARKLAWNAAYHLRIMLDKGRVDFKRAQFLESAIERGQAVLLEEAKIVREMYEKGKISFEGLQKVKGKLETDAEVLRVELTRLGEVVDD